MGSPRTGTARWTRERRLALWSALSLGWLLPSVGCQVEYAGMTLPSGKYMHDDVQYFQPGPDFPWSNTQAATQRARMQALGMEPGPAGAGGMVNAPVPPGALPAVQEVGGRIQNINAGGMPPPPGLQNVPPPPVPAGPPGAPAVPAPGPAAPVVPPPM